MVLIPVGRSLFLKHQKLKTTQTKTTKAKYGMPVQDTVQMARELKNDSNITQIDFL